MEVSNNLTYSVNLPGGQSRLREAILYVSEKCQAAASFGLVKLNKILWKADFDAFAERGVPVTGRQYQRQKKGPVPIEMLPVLQGLLRDGLLEIDRIPVVDFDERRPRPLAAPNLRHFSQADLSFLDRAIEFYWGYTGRGASDQSHGVAWKTRSNGDPMPYELAYLSDERVSDGMLRRMINKGATLGLRSR